MKKFLEQRVEELELEVKLLRAKIKLSETKDTSKYLNNYTKHEPFKDYMYNSSSTLISEPELETAFASLDAVVKLESITHLDSDFPPYPDIWGSWDDKNPKNPLDVISEENPPAIPDWGGTSEFDKTDKDFLEWLKSNEAKNAYEISKHITNKYNKAVYRPFKAK